MTSIININDRGTLTLPKELRERLGVSGPGQVMIEETDDGVLLRASATFPIEIYTKERRAEFQRNNEIALKPYAARIKRALK